MTERVATRGQVVRRPIGGSTWFGLMVGGWIALLVVVALVGTVLFSPRRQAS